MDYTSVQVSQLPPLAVENASLIPHQVGAILYKDTIQNLGAFIANLVGSSQGVGYFPLAVTDGDQLDPTPGYPAFFLCGPGTYLNVNGFPNVVCTGDLNVVMTTALGTSWTLAVQIPVTVTQEPANLQNVLNQGKSASYDSGISNVNILTGTANDRDISFNISDGTKVSQFSINNDSSFISNVTNDDFCGISAAAGFLDISQVDQSTGKFSKLTIEKPTEDNTFIIPNKANPDNYRLISEPLTIYTVATLPSLATLGDRAIVSDALSPTYLAIAVGGGGINAPVWYNGTNWLTN